MRFSKLFFIFFISNVIFAQNRVELSNKEYLVLQDKVRSLINSNVDSAFIFADKIERSNNNIHKAFAFGAKSYLFQLKGDSIKSNQFYKQAFVFLDKVSPSNEKIKLNAYLLNSGGLSDWKRADYSNAIEKFQEGKILSEKVGDKIQVIKFNNNIALIYVDVGNYKSAISIAKQSEKTIDKIEYLFSKEQFVGNKSNNYFDLGNFYQDYYKSKKDRIYLLDSAEYYYKKAIIYSKSRLLVKINAQINLGIIYTYRNKFTDAEKIYGDALQFTKENEMYNEYCNVSYNLGDLYFSIKNYDKALVYFKKVDSIYKLNKLNYWEYTNSNYFQAKIYVSYKNPEEALKHSEIYLANFDKLESKLNKETLEVNFRLTNSDLKKEMVQVQKEYSNQVLIEKGSMFFFILLIAFLFIILYKAKREKRRVNEKVNSLLDEFKNNKEKSNLYLESLNRKLVTSKDLQSSENKITTNSISLDVVKENEIMKKLISLEKKQFYLHSDFSLKTVAKKIKTNTAYLSSVVNKRLGKSFSEYANELKINYVINEMISNPTYRKYSTQAIAESVGFKNAVSFTKSFSKRTGVTPIQFTKRLV